MAVFAALAKRARRSAPWYAKLVVAGCVAYALTPVDFVPDAIPVVGFIDDLIFVPAPVLADGRERSREIEARAPRLSMPALAAAVVLIALWTVR